MTAKSGYVAIVGRPNVGKSTLLNQLIGEKVSITSPKPQTTRCQILGIKHIDHAQIIYVDTPGIHEEEKRAMNRYLNRLSQATLTEADIIVFMIDARGFNKEDQLVLNKLIKIERPIMLVINKIDLLPEKTMVLPLIDNMQKKFSFVHIIPISAKQQDNIAHFEQTILSLLPEGPLFFPADQVTDKSERFQVAEIIREKLIMLTDQELPYATTVQVEQYKQTDKCLEISAIIWVERSGQKAIVIGKGGEKLKKVGILARRDIEKLSHSKVFLRLWVKVKENWTDDVKAMRGLGYE